MPRRRHILVVLASAAALSGAWSLAVPGAASAWAVPAARAAAWGRAVEVPGLGALNKGGNAGVLSVSCTSALSCAAGGYYTDQHRRDQGFVAVKRHGQWRRAIEVPGLAALNKGGHAQVLSVSCASAGNCAAGGTYLGRSGHSRGFVVSEKSGVWGQAIELLGLPGMGAGGNVGVSQVSCGSAGYCTAGGYYTDSGDHRQGFVADEKNGIWGQAIGVPGLAALNAGGSAFVWSVSCPSAGNCAAVGSYGNLVGQGFVVNEKNGAWGQAIEVPGLGSLNQGGSASAMSVSCASAGNCAAGGDYTDVSGNEQGFVANEKNGRWHWAIEVPGLGELNLTNNDPLAYAGSISCTRGGNCLAGGDYGWPYSWAYVASETNGVWGQATGVPTLESLVVDGRWASVLSVSCSSAGNCAVGGDYENMTYQGDFTGAFVIRQQNGRWGKAINVPGLGALNKVGAAAVVSVSCGSAASCVAGGHYTDGHGHPQGFVN